MTPGVGIRIEGPAPNRPAGRLVVLLVPILLGTWVLALRGGFPDTVSGVAVGLAGAAWLGAVAAARAMRPRGAEPGTRGTRGLLLWIVVGALALRVPLLAADLRLSDDVHRYVWEGALVTEGISPYAYAPEAPELEAQRAARADVFGRMNNTAISAAYPPVAQAAFALVVLVAGEHPVLGMRVFFTLCDLAVLAALVVLLRARGASPAAAVAWGWSPLVAIAYAGSGHFDSLGIALCVGGLVAVGARRAGGEFAGTALLGLGVLVKILPAVALPFALGRVRRPVACVALLAAVLALCLAPFLVLQGGTQGLLRGMSEYGLRWESTSLLYRWIEPPLRGVFDGPGLLDPRRVGRGIVLLLWGAVVAIAWRRRVDPVVGCAAALGAFLLLTPTLHPWYVTWVVPFLAFEFRGVWALRSLAAAAPLLYWPVAGWRTEGVWAEPPWLWPLVALPVFVLLALAWLRRPGAAQRVQGEEGNG